ncbi:MAG: DnaB-like helicase C-terminal domain-containing protein [Sphaerochaeta sp.]
MERLPGCILEAVDDIEQRVANYGIDGLSTGFKKMDTVFGGLQKTRLYYVAARPSQGKSTLLMNMAANQKVPILFVHGGEQQEGAVEKRLISYKGRIDNKHINNGTFTSRDSENLTKACDGVDREERLHRL